MSEPWEEWRSAAQNDLLQPACRDLSEQLEWDGIVLTPDEWRWLICAAIKGTKIVSGIDGGIVTLGGSSRALTKSEGTDAITLAFSLGDAPWDYKMANQKRVVWCHSVCLARGLSPNEDHLADQYGD